MRWVVCLLLLACAPIATAYSCSSCDVRGLQRRASLHSTKGCIDPSFSAASFALSLRGGSVARPTGHLLNLIDSPTKAYSALLVGILASSLALKAASAASTSTENSHRDTAQSVASLPVVRSLGRRYLVAFWLLKLADWLQGPYFYDVYSRKVLRGRSVPLGADEISKLFLVGFATAGTFGPSIGKMVDRIGRKAGVLALALASSLSALSVHSRHLSALVAGRALGGVGASLLSIAPEAWLVGEAHRLGATSQLGHIFTWAYFGDSLAALFAGQLAAILATYFGPAGPFTASSFVLALAAGLVITCWRENRASDREAHSSVRSALPPPSIGETLRVLAGDSRIACLGLTQALFEGAMYIFVLQWAPLMRDAWTSASRATVHASPPYGSLFSCFMASCLLGSSLVPIVHRSVSIERLFSALLGVSSLSLALTSRAHVNSVVSLTAGFCVFEMCVGMYFPSVSWLRVQVLPERHRSILMSMFGVPLNLFVIAVSLNIHRLGSRGALQVASIALGVASMAALFLRAKEPNRPSGST